jgi:hypothetical protein
MKLWVITTEKYDYDEYDGFVIRAKNKKEARELAVKAAKSGDNAYVFADPERSKCVEILKKGTPEVILSSFNAG